MKRFRRAVLNGLTVLSAVMALIITASWVRSYWRSDAILFLSRDRQAMLSAATNRGRLGMLFEQFDFTASRSRFQPGFTHMTTLATVPKQLPPTFLGVNYERTAYASPFALRTVYVSFPHGYLLICFVALPAYRFYHRIRRRQLILPGHCPACGYDLRATPNRCPECGRAVLKTVHAADR